MSLQFILGGSGSGKSTYLYNGVIAESMKYPDKNYFVVVPEQYTMAIQKRMVGLHPRKGILNIDVVSFQRLAYKVFEEVGVKDYPVLDDTGKNLIIRRILEQNKAKLKYFGSNINNTGFVAEMKSVISEMLQYDISVERLDEIQKSTDENSILGLKLNDIHMVYAGFKTFIEDHYVTSEEILDVLCKKISDSAMIRNSVVVLDGFTGFTPVQYKLISLMLTLCDQVKIALTIDAKEKINVVHGMENLFFMSKDVIAKLYKTCDELHVDIINPVVVEDEINSRFNESAELAFLEKNLFREDMGKYSDDVHDLMIYAAQYPKDEINFIAAEILKLTRLQGYQYHEIAVVTADLDTYGKLAANILGQNDIPYFLDQKRHVRNNPFVGMIRGVLEVIEKNYTYDSMFKYLRTGMTSLSREDIDYLENYCLAVGIRGRNRWIQEWTRKFRRISGTDLVRLNALRVQIIENILPLEERIKEADGNVRVMTQALYEYMVRMQCEKRLQEMAGDADNEYTQIYKKVIELLDKLVALLGDERVSFKEYNKILASGFEEIKIGLIPQTNDCVLIGDIERTRLDHIKVMLFAGVNDECIPKKNDNRSILSESDRDRLEQMNVNLSMTSRQKAFVQRFYLYLVMTKTSKKLYITYSMRGMDQKARMLSYLIRVICRIFPRIPIISRKDSGSSYLKIPKADILWSEDNLVRALSESVALELYGKQLTGSVTSFENYASCRYAYFLRYGLGLYEREEYTFEASDFGTVLHAVIEDVSGKIVKEGKSFSGISDSERKRMVEESIQLISGIYGNTILKDSSRNEFLVKRMSELADRTVQTIGQQLENGTFVPDEFEAEFLSDVKDLPADIRFYMQGKIDRIDVCEDDNNLYVRVVDYKSGQSDFKLLKAYYGLKIQLIIYMKAAMELEQRKHPDKKIIPSGMLYYNIDNPIVETDSESLQEIETLIRRQLRMRGVVNSDEDIIKKMDDSSGSSLSIPVSRKADGEIDASKSRIMSTEDFERLEEFIDKMSYEQAKDIMTGSILLNPYKDGDENSCRYCEYSAVCGFGTDLKKYRFRRLKKFKDEQLWEKIKEMTKKDGEDMD